VTGGDKPGAFDFKARAVRGLEARMKREVAMVYVRLVEHLNSDARKPGRRSSASSSWHCRLALTVKLPSHPQIRRPVNAAHAPVFGLVAVAVLLFERILRRLVAALCCRSDAVAIGGLVELIQPIFGRGAEIGDLINDALGAIGALALCAFIQARMRLALLIAIAAFTPVLWPVADAGVAYALRARAFPTLMGGMTWPDRYFIHARGVALSRTLLPPAWHRDRDPPSLLVETVGTRWPGVTHSEPYSDWRGYSRLMIDITNPDKRPLTLTLRVHDLAHDNQASDRFNRNLLLAGSRRQTVVVPLYDIERAPVGRQIDLSRIAGVIVFGDGDPASVGRHFYLTRIWLE
jgi:hypothetical protein